MKRFKTKESLFSYLDRQVADIKTKVVRDSDGIMLYEVNSYISIFARFTEAKKKQVELNFNASMDRRN